MAINYSTILNKKSKGLTKSESYLIQKCNSTFLSLWSFPNLFKKEGHELCDIFVVFKEHIFIFSDKTCEFGENEDLQLFWQRWYRKAIYESAQQLIGTERWLKRTPNRIFLDAKCNIRFPHQICINNKTRFHKIIVAHGAKQSCKKSVGGSGSLHLDTNIVSGKYNAPELFTIGKFDNNSEYIHVFDDVTLNIIMDSLDTVMDFANYLSDKEDWINSGRNICVYG